MDEEPQSPQEPPMIPRGKLWASLAIPPVICVIGTLAAGSAYAGNSYGFEFLYVLPVGLLAILIGLGFFIQAWRVRYRGRSLALTASGYFFGQIILCLTLWFGTCMLFAG
jgi:hypothetical protein